MTKLRKIYLTDITIIILLNRISLFKKVIECTISYQLVNKKSKLLGDNYILYMEAKTMWNLSYMCLKPELPVPLCEI